MRIIVSFYFMITVILYVSAQDVVLYKAREHGALARERLYIVDQDGIPVAGAKTREDV